MAAEKATRAPLAARWLGASRSSLKMRQVYEIMTENSAMRGFLAGFGRGGRDAAPRSRPKRYAQI